jgi:hypothetical protein
MSKVSSNFLLYTGFDGKVKLNVLIEEGTIWLTQRELATLFGKPTAVIGKHFNSIFETGELDQAMVCKRFEHTSDDGKSALTDFYNLDAILAIGFRINSYQGTQFRIWITNTLKDYILKGRAFNEELQAQGQSVFGK